MSWVVTAIVGVTVATTAYSQDQQRKSVNAQKDAMNAARVADETEKAKASLSANSAIVERRKRMRSGRGLTASTEPIGATVLGQAAAGGERAGINPVAGGMF